MQIPINVEAEIVAGDTPGTLNLVLSINLMDGTELDVSPPIPATLGGAVGFGPIPIKILEGGGFGSSSAPQSMPASGAVAERMAGRAVPVQPAQKR